MAEEYTWVNAVGAHWKNIEAEYNAEWAKLAYLDGPGYTVWDRMEAKSNLHRKYFSRSSSHGVVNSTRDTLPQSVESRFTSPMAESKQQGKVGMADYAREIQESCARILELLREEINATQSESTSYVVPTSVETFPSMEPIDTSESLTELLQVSKDFLPSMEQIEEQPIANDSVGVSKLRAEVVTPMCEIISNPLILMPYLNHDVSCAFSGTFYKRTIRFADPLNLAIPIDLRRFTNVMIPLPNLLIMKLSSVFIPPLPKPPDLNHNGIANFQPPPKPPDIVSLLTLIVLMIEVFPSFSTTLDAQKLFAYLPHRNKITWSHTSSMYAQHSFNILGLVLFFHFLRSYTMNPTEFILDHGTKVGIQWGCINHFLHLYGMVVKSVSIQHVCGGTLLIEYFWADYGCSNESNLPLASHVTKIIVMSPTNSLQGKLRHGCVLWLAIDIVVSLVSCVEKANGHICYCLQFRQLHMNINIRSYWYRNPTSCQSIEFNIMSSLDSYGVVMIEVWMGKQPKKRIVSLIVGCCTSIMKYQQVFFFICVSPSVLTWFCLFKTQQQMGLSEKAIQEVLAHMALIVADIKKLDYLVPYTYLATCVSIVGLHDGSCWRLNQLVILVDTMMLLEILFTNIVPLSLLVEIFLYLRYRDITFKKLLPVSDYPAQSIASPKCHGCTLTLLELEDMLQHLQKLAPEPYHVYSLNYMHDLFPNGALGVVGFFSFSAAACVVTATECLLAMTLSLVFYTKKIKQDKAFVTKAFTCGKIKEINNSTLLDVFSYDLSDSPPIVNSLESLIHHIGGEVFKIECGPMAIMGSPSQTALVGLRLSRDNFYIFDGLMWHVLTLQLATTMSKFINEQEPYSNVLEQRSQLCVN